ncbi:MarR family winged helix-turn-helix transcriptional regulator [Frankia sp. AgB32]|uniref:MarR family winged helix-turn-helix transcriptional regulator n=1 Tax=Frankia sp. AgB32 TaxID=631119 RepID=UPI00200DC72D|nr:MarR family transcriptional regulator [Frankia sp. AgB32]MCK9896078.1 MarR family transcriptional regulator [Frankia sp. AgB32]
MSTGMPAAARDTLIAHLAETLGRDLATRTVLFHHHLAARLGLSVTDLKCLDLLRAADLPLTASNLADRIGLTAGSVTGVADRLEAAGFVERVRDPHDRRRWELRPVPDRQRDIAALFAPLGAAMADLAACYDTHQLEAITSFLTRLATILDGQTEALRTTVPAKPTTPG